MMMKALLKITYVSFLHFTKIIIKVLRSNGSYGSMIQNAPKLNVQDVQLWSQTFLTYAKGYNDLDDIIRGNEEYPTLADGESDSRLQVRRTCFLRRKQAAHLMIKSAVERGTDTTTKSRCRPKIS